MKKIVLLSIMLLVSANFFGQQPTIIYGKIDNIKWNQVSLEINSFDTVDMTLIQKRIYTTLDSNGCFRFLTFDITRPNTYCSFRNSAASTSMYLSPGDSIFMSANYSLFKETLKYAGRGATKNNYLIKYILTFEDNNKINRSQSTVDVQSFQTVNYQYYQDKLEFLDNYHQNYRLKEGFYNRERKRIEYEYVNRILEHFHTYTHYYLNKPGSVAYIKRAVDSIRLEDAAVLIHFNNLMYYYGDFKSRNRDFSKAPGIHQKLDFAENSLTGLVKKLYLKQLIINTLNNATNNLEREYWLDFFYANLHTDFTNKLLSEQFFHLYRRNSAGSETFAILLLLLTIAGLCIFLVKLFLRRYYRQNRKGSAPAGLQQSLKTIRNKTNVAKLSFWIRIIVFVLIALLILLLILGGVFSGEYAITNFTVFVSVNIAIQAFWLMPQFYGKKKYQAYLAATFLHICLIIASIVSISYKFPAVSEFLFTIPDNYLNHKFSPVFLSILTTVIYALFYCCAWIIYLLNHMAKKALSLRNLFKSGFIHMEFLIVGLCIITAIVIFFANSDSNTNYRQETSISEALTFYLSVIFFLFLTFYLVPEYLLKKRYIRFIALNIIILFIGVVLYNLLYMVQTHHALRSNNISLSPIDLLNLRYGTNFQQLTVAVLLVFPAILYNYVKQLVVGQKTEGFRLYRAKEAELMHLRSQVNPHFLFNSLNTLYSYALQEKNDKTAEPIARLASLMRYMIDDMEKDFIPLKREADYIRDYIQLQSIRSSVKHQVDMNMQIEPDYAYAIAPMLLIPFVENAFKHGMNPNKKSVLKIDLKACNGQIQFVIENSTDKNHTTFYKEKGFGIGISNVKQRLEHIYPGKYNLSIAETAGRFIVIMDINL